MSQPGLAVLAAITLMNTWQVAPRQPQMAAPPGRGVISGSLATGDKGTPVRKATVRLSRVGPALTKTVTSDSEGRFTFTELPPGDYRLSATRPGYLDMVYGATLPGAMPGTPITLAEDQKIEKLTMTLPRGGVISGILTDEFGDPAYNTPVRALRFSYRSGERIVTQVGIATTDDRGAYRLAGLLPGEYIVNAVPRDAVSTLAAQANALRQRQAQMASDPRASANNPAAAEIREQLARMAAAPPPPPIPSSGYVPIYYPGATMPSNGTIVSLGISEERSGVDFALTILDTATIAGMVINAEGPLPEDTRVQLIDPALPVPGVGVWFRNTEPDGKFSFQGVVPGTYVLRAHTALSLAEGGNVLTAAMNVSVGGTGVTDVALTMKGGVPVSGRLSLAGLPPQVDASRLRLMLRQIQSSADWESPPPRVTLNADGTFAVENAAPGRYRFAVSGVPEGWTIDSAVVGGIDTADHHLNVERDGKYADGDIKLTNSQAELSGVLSTIKDTPAIGHTVILFPADRAMWLPESRRIHVVLSGKDGRYSLKGLPPGDYRVVSLLGPEPGRESDPAWLSELFALSHAVKLTGGQTVTQNITVK